MDGRSDTLYLCYCIDKDAGERRRPEVFAALEYEHAPAAMEEDEEDDAPGLPPPVTQPPPEALPAYPEYSPEPSPGVSRQSLPGELPSQYDEEEEEAEGSQLLPGSDLF
jgi:hypothetical protein